MNWIKLLPVAIAGLVLGGCTSILNEEAIVDKEVPALSQPEPAVIDDRQIVQQMTAKVTEMMDSGSVVEMKSLIEKLKKEPKATCKQSNLSF